jgi:NhaP-type Na+/H+ or K+/H+ antiporter
LERFDVTAPITFVAAGVLLTHGPLAFLGIQPSNELIKELAEFTLALVLFSDASRVGLHELRAEAGLYLRLLGVALPLPIGLGTLLALALTGGGSIWPAFGAVAVAPAVEGLTWQIVLYAVLSLTVIRMVPVAVALAGARLGWATTALVGWFGPRGPGVGGVRTPGIGRAGQPHRRPRRRRHHDHRVDQRRRTRCHGRSGGHPVRGSAHPSGRRTRRRARRRGNTRHT